MVNKKEFKLFSIVMLIEVVTNLILLAIYKTPINQEVVIQVLIFSLVTAFAVDKFCFSKDNHTTERGSQ